MKLFETFQEKYTNLIKQKLAEALEDKRIKNTKSYPADKLNNLKQKIIKILLIVYCYKKTKNYK